MQCAPNMEKLISDCSSVIRNHLAIVLEVTALWVWLMKTNNFVSSPSSEFLLPKHVLKVFNGQRVVLGKEEGKKKLLFPRHECFAKVVGRNDLRQLLDCILITSSCDKSADLDGHVLTNTNPVFRVNSCSARTSDSPPDYKYCTSLISSLGLLFFSSYWDGEATIQRKLLNEEAFIPHYYHRAPNFHPTLFSHVSWIGLKPWISVSSNSLSSDRYMHYTNFADNSIITLLKVNCRDTSHVKNLALSCTFLAKCARFLHYWSCKPRIVHVSCTSYFSR